MAKFQGVWYNHRSHTRDAVDIAAANVIEATNALLLYMKYWGGDECTYKDIVSIGEESDNRCITFPEQLARYQQTHWGQDPNFLKWTDYEIRSERFG